MFAPPEDAQAARDHNPMVTASDRPARKIMALVL
jgi:hypothetical protein